MNRRLYPSWPIDNELHAVDLDNLFSQRSRNLNGDVIACSAPMRQISRSLGEKTEYFHLNGLGQWEGLAVHVKDYGTILFAAPVERPREDNQETDAPEQADSFNSKAHPLPGASIWVSRDMRMDANEIAAFIVAITGDSNIKFMNPATGELIATPPVPAFRQKIKNRALNL